MQLNSVAQTQPVMVAGAPTDAAVCFMLCSAGTDLSCPDAVVVVNTGNRRLTGVAITGSTTCQMAAGALLEPLGAFKCSVSTRHIFLLTQNSNVVLMLSHHG